MLRNHFNLLYGGMLASLLLATPATATVFTFEDTWINWPGYTSSLGDENGTPKIESMTVSVNDNGILETISINLHDSTLRQRFDSLFINSYNLTTTSSQWDDWDFFVHDGGAHHANRTVGNVPDDGLYQVLADYEYTYAAKHRVGNPNGIDENSLSLMDDSFGASHSGYAITYDLTSFNIDVSDGFFIAYAPWCANDVIGGGTDPVPEPATLLLFGSGVAGLAAWRRKTL